MNDGDITTGEQIDNYLKKYFKSSIYRGIVVNDAIPALQKNQFVINNRDEHWTAAYKLNDGVLREFDSYGRDMIPGIPDTFVPVKQRQGASGIDNSDCGQRTIAFILKKFL